MKFLTVAFMTLTLLAASGCWWTTHDSSKGGITPVNEEFSITVPSSATVKQGGETTFDVSLNRGDYFKQDVQLNIKANGISIAPTSILVKAGDKPQVTIRITAVSDLALGEYIVSITGTPITGRPASTAFTVTVAAK